MMVRRKVRCRLKVEGEGGPCSLQMLEGIDLPPKHSMVWTGVFSGDPADDGLELTITFWICPIHREVEIPPATAEEIADLDEQLRRAREARAAAGRAS